MAKYNFKGDINNISEKQLEFINKAIEKHGFQNCDVTFEPFGQSGDNYVASMKRITIEGENVKLKIVAKIAPNHEILRQGMNTLLLFKNEHIMYTELLPRMVQLQKDANIPEEELVRYPKCYGSFAEDPNEVLLLEDLKTSDFTMLNRFESLSDDCIKSVLKNFAVFHSLSYVLRHKDPETYDRIRVKLQDMWSVMADSEEKKIYFQGVEDDAINVLEDQNCIDLMRLKIADKMNFSAKFRQHCRDMFCEADSDHKYSAIVHGDCWTNNIMFRFQDTKLSASIMIDFQLSKNSSPVYDVMYMIFNCTDHEIRRQNFYNWIDYYYSELQKSLANFNMNVDYIYPRERLYIDLKRYGKVMFGLCMCLANVLIRKSEDAAKVMEAVKNENILEQPQEFGISQLDKESRLLFKNRILGVLTSYIEFGLI